jgi:hypothetical protein
LGSFTPLELLLSGALAGGNAVDACIGNVAGGGRFGAGHKNKKASLASLLPQGTGKEAFDALQPLKSLKDTPL